MRDAFSGFHPLVNFAFFLAAVLCGMFFMHPVFLGISLVCSLAYSLYLGGRKSLKFSLLYMLPLLLLVAVLNPLLNHEGATILLYINDNPLTLEAIVYGLASAVMFVSMLLWFSCYNAVMTSDKFLYLFGRVIPSLSLVLSMTLRLVPRLRAQLRVISHAQKCVGRDASQGNVVRRVRNGGKILFILITWALENAVDTADSMRSRGFGLRGRTAFSNYRFDARDRAAMGILAGLFAVVLAGLFAGQNTAVYFPLVTLPPLTPFSFVVYAAYAVLLLFPLIVNLQEAIVWRRLKSAA